MTEKAIDRDHQRVEESLKRGRARMVVANTIIGTSVVGIILAGISYFGRAYFSQFADPADAAQAYEGLIALAVFLLVGSLTLPFLLIFLRGPKAEWERIFDMVLSQRRHFRLMLFGSFFLVAAELSTPLLMKYMLDEVVVARRDAVMLTIILAVLLVILLVRIGAGMLRIFNAQALSYRVGANIRERLYAHLQSLSYSFFDRARQGELMSKVTNDVEKLQFFMLNSSEDFFVAPLKVYGGVACVFFLNWRLALVILVTAPIIGLLLRITSGKLRTINRAAQEWIGNLTAELAEGINTIRLAQSFGLERSELDKFKDANRTALSKLLHHARLSSIVLPVLEFIGFLAPVIIIAMLCYQAIGSDQSIEVGKLVAIVGIAALVANPLGKLSRIVVTLAMGEAASSRIHSVLETKRQIKDRDNAVPIADTNGYLRFENVNLRYGSNEPQVLTDINLEIMPGQVVAFVGESGSGKSSIVNLVPRFYEPTAGRVVLDDYDLRDIKLNSLRSHIGIVSQETILIHGTVHDNIAYGSPHADHKDILDAAMSANAHNFIMEFPEGYETMVGEKGVTLSGGQRQRIAIARALLRDPRILVLDEATSALDSISEAIVQDALNKLMYGRTTLMVAHRLSTVRRADLIVVLKNGRIVETGKHDELVGIRDGEYARLVKLQGV